MRIGKAERVARAHVIPPSATRRRLPPWILCLTSPPGVVLSLSRTRSLASPSSLLVPHPETCCRIHFGGLSPLDFLHLRPQEAKFFRAHTRPGRALCKSLQSTRVAQVTEELPLSVGSALVLGSDGLWDMVSPNFAVRKLRTVDEADHAAYTLVTTARQRWPAGEDIDDITAVTALLISQEVGSATEESR